MLVKNTINLAETVYATSAYYFLRSQEKPRKIF